MNIFGILSMIVYIAAFLFMEYCGKYIMETSYADFGSIVTLLLLLTGAVLAGFQEKEYCSPASVKKWEMELEELQKQIEERKRRLEKEQEL